jgi:hypothetical protein
LRRAGQHLVCWPSGARVGLAPLLPVARREFLWCQIAKIAVGPVAIEVLPLGLNRLLCFGRSEEHVLVQKFITQPAVERLNERVLHWFAGFDIVPVDTAAGPSLYRCAR